MVNVELAFKVGEIVLTTMSSVGAKALVTEGIKKLTPENISTAKQVCVKVAEGAMVSSVATVCRKALKDDIAKVKEGIDKVTSSFTKEENESPVVEVTDAEIISE